MGLEELVKTLDNDDFDILKKQFPNKWEYLNKKLAYPYEYFNSTDDYEKPPEIFFSKKNFFSKLKKNACPSDEKIGRKKLLEHLKSKMVKN